MLLPLLPNLEHAKELERLLTRFFLIEKGSAVYICPVDQAELTAEVLSFPDELEQESAYDQQQYAIPFSLADGGYYLICPSGKWEQKFGFTIDERSIMYEMQAYYQHYQELKKMQDQVQQAIGS